ncbi:MAG: hypothetical protein FJ098_07295 [Deltaproteobacteria bacterium]|nr:hypothetical protein [Deltaproteobacteria bacterium]
MAHRTVLIPLLVLSLHLAAPREAVAETHPSIGVAGGAIIPNGKLNRNTKIEWDFQYNWALFVDIPIVKYFQLGPSAEIYRVGKLHLADMCLAFRFVIPTSYLAIHLGVVPGITAAAERVHVNLGGEVGLTGRIVANLAWFVDAKYEEVFTRGGGLHTIHLYGGLKFFF